MSFEPFIPTSNAESPVPITGEALNLRGLVASITTLKQVPTLSDLYAFLEAFRVEWEELRPYVSFKPGTYARHLLVRGEHAEALLLCWRPGQKTPIHDHNGSIGAVRVCGGVLWETMFTLDDTQTLRYESAREWTDGYVTGADLPDIHQIGNPEVSGQELITLHIYAPPLGVLNTYKVGTSEIGQYSPNEFIDGAGI
jgi:cysteine dioxygenase